MNQTKPMRGMAHAISDNVWLVVLYEKGEGIVICAQVLRDTGKAFGAVVLERFCPDKFSFVDWRWVDLRAPIHVPNIPNSDGIFRDWRYDEVLIEWDDPTGHLGKYEEVDMNYVALGKQVQEVLSNESIL